MNNIIPTPNSSKKFLTGASISLVVALAMIVSIQHAQAAEYPNILAGQDLTVGASNQNVVVLQGLLSELGYLHVPAGVPFGYYGGLTRNAVAAYQAKLGVSPAVGYYGPVTKVAMNADFASHDWLKLLGWTN
jgi:peptidoglycan hydrolase-like protein with peptidoglycan-binding domain